MLTNTTRLFRTMHSLNVWLSVFCSRSAQFEALGCLSIYSCVNGLGLIFPALQISLPPLITRSFSIEMLFPPDSGIVDITQAPYYADPADNDSDDTNAIRQALSDHAGEGKIIYLPNGVYNVSEQIEFPQGKPGWKWSGNRLQGQSTDSTILKLRDNVTEFSNPDQPLAIIRTTGFEEDWEVAQRFNNDISHLTIQTGQGNPGTIGLQFMSNNTGVLEAVQVLSEDGQGKYGVDFGFASENGPLLVKDLLVDGFEIGVFTSSSLNSQTFENILLRNQKQVGWENQGQKVAVRNLTVDRSRSEGVHSADGNFVLIGGAFSNGPSSLPAINLGGGYAYLRDITATDYQQVLASVTPSGGVQSRTLSEYVSHSVLNTSSEVPSTSLNLLIEDTPVVPMPPLSEWANIKDFGATESDSYANDNDDELAIQRAIDSGAKAVYFPNQVRDSYPIKPGAYDWNTVYVRGNVQRIVGMEAGRNFAPPLGTLVIEEEGPPVVMIERLNDIKIINNTSRTVIVKNTNAQIEANGSGKTFLEDVVTGGETSIQVSGGHKLYARQLNPEWNGNSKPQNVPLINNDGGQVWILGLKTETGGTIIRTQNGGETEVLGGHQYVIGTPQGGNDNMFVVEDASFSVTSVEANFGGGSPYDTYLLSTHDGIVREIDRVDIPYAGAGNAKAFPLLVTNYSNAHNAISIDETAIIPKDRTNPLFILLMSIERFRTNLSHRLRQFKR